MALINLLKFLSFWRSKHSLLWVSKSNPENSCKSFKWIATGQITWGNGSWQHPICSCWPRMRPGSPTRTEGCLLRCQPIVECFAYFPMWKFLWLFWLFWLSSIQTWWNYLGWHKTGAGQWTTWCYHKRTGLSLNLCHYLHPFWTFFTNFMETSWKTFLTPVCATFFW